MKRGFHSLLGRPVDQYASHMLVYSSIESVSYLALDANFSWSAALFLSAAGLRLLVEPLGMVLRRVTWKLPKTIDDPLTALHQNLFLNDLKSDVLKYHLTESQHLSLIRKVSPAFLASQTLNCYLGVNFFRAVHAICDSPEHYPGLLQAGFLWMPQIVAFDSLFIAPCLVGLLNYCVLRRSFHPLLLPYSVHNKAVLAFSTTLAAVLLPGAYLISWSGVVTTHLAIEALKASLKPRVASLSSDR